MTEKVGSGRKVVSDASKLPESSDPGAILKQVEFYFSDENLPNDKFLWQTSQKNEGWVPIETIHKFARMRRFQPFEAVVDALRTSENLLEVSEDGKNVRRRNALVEPEPEQKKLAFERTVYAKGFGPETETTQFDIESFFDKFGPTRQVRLRRADDGSFKSSVFVEFANLDDAKSFLAADPKPAFGEEEILTMSKQAYVDMKAAEHGFTAHANGKRRRFNAFRQKAPQRGPQKRRRRPDREDQEPTKRVAKEVREEASNGDAEVPATTDSVEIKEVEQTSA